MLWRGVGVAQGIAVGAAYKGLKPVVEFMTWNFCMQVGPTRSWYLEYPESTLL